MAEITLHEGFVVGAVDAADVDGADLPGSKRLREQAGHYGRVTAAGQGQEHFPLPDRGLDFGNFGGGGVPGREAVFGATDLKDEVFVYLRAVLGSGDFRMELHAPQMAEMPGRDR